MKLRITHFHDPEPKTGFIEVGKPEPEWVKLHSAWKARQVKPEMHWKDGKKERPEKGWDIYWKDKKLSNETHYNKQLAEDRTEWFENNMPFKIWCYHDEYHKALQHYEENRRRWDGFKTKRHDNGVNYYTDDISVWFYDSHDCVKVFLPKKSSSVSMFDGLSVSLFEQICEENGIKLSKL